MIELTTYITDNMGGTAWPLRQEIINHVVMQNWKLTHTGPDYGEHPFIKLADFKDAGFWLRHWTIEAVTASGLFEPRWACYAAKSKSLRKFRLDKGERAAMRKACLVQAGPYRQRALEWLAGILPQKEFLRSLKSQVVDWLEGKSKHKNPLSDKQMTLLLRICFQKFPNWTPNLPPQPKFVEVEFFDELTGERAVRLVPAAKVEMQRKQAEYYKRREAL